MRRTLAGLVLVAAALAARADAPPPAPDAMDAAKKDLAEIKALAAPVDGQQGGSGVDLKSYTPGPMGERPPPRPSPQAQEQAAKGTGNWLVDAMDQQQKEARAARTGERGPDPGRAAEASPQGLGGLLERPEGGDASLAPGAEPGAPELRESVFNPLNSFMSGWVSDRDRELLVPKRDSGAGQGPGSAPGAGDAADLVSLLLAPQDSPGTRVEERVADNPYLDTQAGEPAAGPKVFVPPELPDFTPSFQGAGSLGLAPDGRTQDSQRSFIPAFAQPIDDDKYFKQLKKF